MRRTITAVLCVLSTTLAGCGTSSDEAASTGTSDCQEGVRFEGATYTEVGYVDAAGGRAGEAVLGECHDLGRDFAGLTFPEDARTVEVWAVRKVDPGQAIGRKLPTGSRCSLPRASMMTSAPPWSPSSALRVSG